jgi:2-polyprenyl-6-hydroxyphenyl methylase/3-demethylubiquinone-9 3-methyltransferase
MGQSAGTKEQHVAEVAAGERFEFGKNGARFLKSLNEDRIVETRRSLENMLEAGRLVAPGETLFIAIYNYQGTASVRWRKVKRMHNRLPRGLRFPVVVPSFAVLNYAHIIKDFLRLRSFQTMREYGKNRRGMSMWRDVIDWVGGYPFEFAKPKEIFDFYRTGGLMLLRLRTCRGTPGCHQFVFRKTEQAR